MRGAHSFSHRRLLWLRLGCGLSVSKGRFKAVPYLYLNIAPAAANNGTDMAHFMIAHLQGSLHSRILKKILCG